jgi:hypothetical protein
VNKRIPLSERRERDAAKGVDAVIQTINGDAAQPRSGSEEKVILAKVTMYIRPEQVAAIEAIQLAERQRTGKRPDKSDLAQEAIDLLIQKYT